MRGMFVIDVLYVILLILCLATQSYSLNHTKYLCFVKFVRLL